jgi:acyl carrier protein
MTKTSAPIPPASISDAEILARLADIVGASLRIPPSRVTADVSLDELGAESIDLVDISLEVEHAFTVLLPEKHILQLATEIAGDGMVEQNGVLTALGADLLRARLPDVNAGAIAEGTSSKAAIAQFLRVAVWVRVIRGLLETTPRACARCGAPLVQGGPARVRCPACAIDYDVPSGDDIGREWVRRWLAARAP